jgi:GNAT superfamily N-acetyltransferase
MTDFSIRPFRRGDRDQLTGLVNGHAAAVLPGCAIPVNTVLSQFEREPGEFIVDPWVAERVVLVAEQRSAIVAAALLLRYRDDTDVGEGFRGAGEIRWLVFWPMAPTGNKHWDDGQDAAQALIEACCAQMDAWQCEIQIADGSLPTPGIYGVPEQWPHIAALYLRNGFNPDRTEMVFLANLSQLVGPSEPPLPGLRVRRLVGINGTRFVATLDGHEYGYIEVARLDQPERRVGPALADIGNLWVHENQRQGIGTWLVHQAARWLALGGATQLLAYATPDETAMISFLERTGFETITTTQRPWTRATIGSAESTA